MVGDAEYTERDIGCEYKAIERHEEFLEWCASRRPLYTDGDNAVVACSMRSGSVVDTATPGVIATRTTSSSAGSAAH